MAHCNLSDDLPQVLTLRWDEAAAAAEDEAEELCFTLSSQLCWSKSKKNRIYITTYVQYKKTFFTDTLHTILIISLQRPRGLKQNGTQTRKHVIFRLNLCALFSSHGVVCLFRLLTKHFTNKVFSIGCLKNFARKLFQFCLRPLVP